MACPGTDFLLDNGKIGRICQNTTRESTKFTAFYDFRAKVLLTALCEKMYHQFPRTMNSFA
jgi:hypothetical protein